MTEYEFFDELPENHRRNPTWDVLDGYAEALRNNPGRWAQWPTPLSRTSSRGTAGRIRYGHNPRFPAAEFDAESRDGVVYLRYKDRPQGIRIERGDIVVLAEAAYIGRNEDGMHLWSIPGSFDPVDDRIDIDRLPRNTALLFEAVAQ